MQTMHVCIHLVIIGDQDVGPPNDNPWVGGVKWLYATTDTLLLWNLFVFSSNLYLNMMMIQVDLEEMLGETNIVEQKAMKAMIDAARLADELRQEQESAQAAEKNRRAL